MLTQAMMAELFEQGLVYRHDMARWARLQRQGATLWPSPSREITVAGQLMVEELVQPLLEPRVLLPAEVEELESMARAWEAFSVVQLDLVKRGLKGGDPKLERLATQVVDKDQRVLALQDPGYADPITPFLRLDVVRTPEGFRVIDINLTRPAGLGHYIMLDAAYAKVGAYRQFAAREVFSEVVERCFRSWAQCQKVREKASVAILIEETEGDWHNLRVLTETLQAAEFVERAELVSTVAQATDGRFNCVIRGRIKFGQPMFDELLRLPPEKFCIMSPLGRRFLGSKFWFVALRDPEFKPILEESLGEHYSVLEQSIPETGVFHHGDTINFSGRIEPVQAIMGKNRKGWVLKPSAGSSARGVRIGYYLNQWKWDEACSGSGAGTIAQHYFRAKERVPVLDASGVPTEVENHMKYGAFLYGGKVAACEVMARPQPLVHGARDTYFSTCAWKQENS